MKNTIVRILSFIYKFVITRSLIDYIKNKKKELRSYWLCGSFLHCDRTVRFGKICELTGNDCISIEENTGFSDYLYLTAWNKRTYYDPEIKQRSNSSFSPRISIGQNCSFGAFNHITAINSIIIGNNVLTGKWVTITDNSHGNTSLNDLQIHPLDRRMVSKGKVFISDDVWIGDKATILPGVTIGKGAVVAANSVVTKNVRPYTIVAGIPAKEIGARQ